MRSLRPCFLTFVAFACFAAAKSAGAQQVVVGGVVMSSTTDQSLPYATISVDGAAQRFTNDDGSFSLSLLPGDHRLRIKQLGYAPLDTLISVRPGLDLHALTFAMKPVAITLSTVRTFANSCRASEDPAELSGILAELQKNAERAKLLRNQYPFVYELERSTDYSSRGGTQHLKTDTVRFASVVTGLYQPGKLVQLTDSAGSNGLREMRIPELIDMAEAPFLANHCFRFGGIERVGGLPAYRLDFRPSSDLQGPDVEGSAFIDSSSYMILRSVFRLTNPERLLPPVIGVEVTTDYRQIFNGVPLFERIVSSQPLTRASSMLRAEQRQNQRLIAVRFYGQTPEGIQLSENTPSVPRVTQPSAGITPTPAQIGVVTPPAAPSRDSLAILLGVVVDTAGRPLNGAEVRSTDGSAQVTTRDSGQFVLRGLKSGHTNFVVHLVGYGPASFAAELPPGRTHRVRVVLTPATVQLQAVVVTDSLSDPILAQTGYYRRKKAGWGTFITPEEIARRDPAEARDMLRMVTGVDMRQAAHGGTLPYNRRTLSLSGACIMNVFVDGTHVNLGRGMALEDLISGHELGAIEVYSDAGQTPPEFLGFGADCGAIVIWTKGMVTLPPADTTKH